jgi:hypothetical protein
MEKPEEALLFGVFQLIVDIGNEDKVRGYWIGNGSKEPYFGKWD